MNFSDGYMSSSDGEKRERANQLMELLSIPVSNYSGMIDVVELYDVLMDDMKFQKLATLIKNKAFW